MASLLPGELTGSSKGISSHPYRPCFLAGLSYLKTVNTVGSGGRQPVLLAVTPLSLLQVPAHVGLPSGVSSSNVPRKPGPGCELWDFTGLLGSPRHHLAQEAAEVFVESGRKQESGGGGGGVFNSLFSAS